MVCHDVVRLVPSNRLYINSTDVRLGLPTGGLPRCHEVGFTRRFMMGRAGNMGRAQWAGPNWPDILEGQAVKLAARIKSGPISP